MQRTPPDTGHNERSLTPLDKVLSEAEEENQNDDDDEDDETQNQEDNFWPRHGV